MASKKKLRARIAELETEVAILKAQRPMTVLPRTADVPWPRDYWPYGWPKITSGGCITPSDPNQYTINAVA